MEIEKSIMEALEEGVKEIETFTNTKLLEVAKEHSPQVAFNMMMNAGGLLLANGLAIVGDDEERLLIFISIMQGIVKNIKIKMAEHEMTELINKLQKETKK